MVVNVEVSVTSSPLKAAYWIQGSHVVPANINAVFGQHTAAFDARLSDE
jgi:hypothetical protein